MTMANAGVPICCISTPQFITAQKALEKSGWNSAQLTGRIAHYECLPVELCEADLVAVAKSVLPEADASTLRALAVYARSSARYLSAIDSIATRARYTAMQAGRSETTTGDVRKAMQESVIPADAKLHRALTAGEKSKRLAPMVATPIQTPLSRTETILADTNAAPSRSRPQPVLEAPGGHRRHEFEASLTEA